jgi:hypothetical protein
MLAGLINEDMDRRLADLHSALTEGREIGVTFEPAYQHINTSQPDRLIVDIIGTPRRLVFVPSMAVSVAQQLQANGFAASAERIRDCIP